MFKEWLNKKKKMFFLALFIGICYIFNVRFVSRCIIVFLLVFFNGFVWAKEAKIILKNGGLLYGEVVQEEDDWVLVEIAEGGSLGLYRDEIKSIVYNPAGKVKKKNYITVSGQTTYLVGLTWEDNWDSLIKKAAKRYRLDPFLIKAVAKVESNFDPYVISHKGASGLMQLMPVTAKDCRVDDIFDAEENIEGGTKFLRYLWDIFDGDLKLVLAGYNAGPNAVRKYKGVPPYRETRNYIKKVLFYYSYYKDE